MQTVEIELISDFICPWCYLGKTRIDKLKNKLANEIHLDISLSPYVLYPHIPKGGLPKSDFAKNTKPGMGKSLKQEAKMEGIEINYRNIERIPYSLEAHRLVEIVDDNATKFELAKRIFYAYFEKGQDIEDLDFLVSLGNKVGMEKSLLSRFLMTDFGMPAVQTGIHRNKEEFIRVVPSIRLDKKILLPGLQATETWEKYIRRAVVLG